MSDEQANQAIRDRVRLMQSLTNITPTDDEIVQIEKIRDLARILGSSICLDIAPSRERSLAITHLEETVMWAVKAILMNNPPAIATKNFPVEIKPDNGVIGVEST